MWEHLKSTQLRNDNYLHVDSVEVEDDRDVEWSVAVKLQSVAHFFDHWLTHLTIKHINILFTTS